MSLYIYPDDPARVSIDMLKRMDDDAPGTWYGSVKHNGFRRFATKWKGEWTWKAKPAGSGALKEMPHALREEFEALPWPNDITLDCEWTGTRMIAEHPKHELWVFDLLNDKPFVERRAELYEIVNPHTCNGNWERFKHAPNVHLVPYRRNPGLVEMFAEQLTNPASEGLVVRRADSKIIGHHSRCVENPHVRKILKGNIVEKGGKKCSTE